MLVRKRMALFSVSYAFNLFLHALYLLGGEAPGLPQSQNGSPQWTKKIQFDFGDFACNTKVQETNNTITAFQCFWEVMRETFELHPQTIEMPRLYRFSLVLLCGWKYLNMRLDFFFVHRGPSSKTENETKHVWFQEWVTSDTAFNMSLPKREPLARENTISNTMRESKS